MRLTRLAALVQPGRLKKLSRDFSAPIRALLATSGVWGKRFVLTTRSGDSMEVNRNDLPVWEKYFSFEGCRVEIQNGLFHIFPDDPAHPDYFIQGASDRLSFQPQRWVGQSTPALLVELEKAERSLFSQHGEDGVIQALLERISPKHQFVVEFGAHDGECMSNSRHLIKDHHWQAFLIEPSPRFFKKLQALYRDNPGVKILNSFITKENINSLFHDAGVPKDFDVLSIDVDGPDYYLWQALTDFEPRIVLVEYNASIPPDRAYVVPEDKALQYSGTLREGASLLALCQLAETKGYVPVYTELSGANVFFVHNSVADKFDLEDVTPANLYQPPQFGVLAGGPAPNGRGYE